MRGFHQSSLGVAVFARVEWFCVLGDPCFLAMAGTSSPDISVKPYKDSICSTHKHSNITEQIIVPFRKQIIPEKIVASSVALPSRYSAYL